MSVAYLKAGTRVVYNKVEHVVERQCADGTWVLRNEDTDRSIERKRPAIPS